MRVNVKVEFDPTPIRHIAVQCPACDFWFRGEDITLDSLEYSYQIDFAKFECPKCGRVFGCRGPGIPDDEIVIKKCGDYEEVFKDCLRKRIVFE